MKILKSFLDYSSTCFKAHLMFYMKCDWRKRDFSLSLFIEMSDLMKSKNWICLYMKCQESLSFLPSFFSYIFLKRVYFYAERWRKKLEIHSLLFWDARFVSIWIFSINVNLKMEKRKVFFWRAFKLIRSRMKCSRQGQKM